MIINGTPNINIYINPFNCVFLKNLAKSNIKYIQNDKKYFRLINISILLLLNVFSLNSWINAYNEKINKIEIDRYSFLTIINLKTKIYLIIKNIVSLVDWIFTEESR